MLMRFYTLLDENKVHHNQWALRDFYLYNYFRTIFTDIFMPKHIFT